MKLVSDLKARIRRGYIKPHFDAAFYLYCYGRQMEAGIDPLDHYLQIGRHIRCDPSPEFSVADQLAAHPALLGSDCDPFYLFLRLGKQRGWTAQPSARKIEYITAKGFDEGYYLYAYPDVRASNTNPIQHYMERGWREGRNPNPHFSSRYYLDSNADVRALEINPLYHYIRFGQAQGRRPSSLPPGLIDSHADVPGAHPDGIDAHLMSRLVRQQPDFTSKWLKKNYLVIGLSEADRLNIFLHHYGFMRKTLKHSAIHKIAQGDFIVWQEAPGGQDYRIVLKLAAPINHEGELSLELQQGDACLYILSFTIAPGGALQRTDPSVILISRLQGVRKQFAQVKSATKHFKDVSPPFMLLAALQGLAKGFGVRRLAGVSGAYQVSGPGPDAPQVDLSYDRFFEAVGAERASAALFASVLPLPEKPMSQVKAGHKLRTKAKREFKGQISALVHAAITPALASRSAPALGPLPVAANDSGPRAQAWSVESGTARLAPEIVSLERERL